MRRATIRAVSCSLAAAMLLGGCASSSRSPYAVHDQLQRDPARSRELLAQAGRAMPERPEEAERLLREALAADLYNGPAHNNLGLLLLARGELYQAAAEFQWARQLLPGQPEPRVNLALTLEQAGRTDEALAAYAAALEASDSYLPALLGRTRLEVASGQHGPHTLEALDDIALRGDQEWREWAVRWRGKIEERSER